MAKFDTITKQLIQTYPHDFVRFALQRDDIQCVNVLDTEQPTIRHTDSLLRAQVGGQDAIVLHEFQTTDDSTMPQRMARYIGHCIGQYRLPVYAHVLYLRRHAGRRDPGYYLQEHPDYPVAIRYKVLRLSQLPGQAVLDGGFVGLLPFTPLMQPPAGVAEAAWLAQCVAHAAVLPLAPAAKADCLAGLAILGGLAYNPQTITALLSKEQLMDLMRESAFAQLLTEDARAEALKQGLEQGLEQGIKQGIEQGGRARAIEALLDVLAIRFGIAASDPLATHLGALDDVQHLKQLHRTAIQVPSLEAFSNLLDADK